MRLHGEWNINFILYVLNTEAVSGSSPMLGSFQYTSTNAHLAHSFELREKEYQIR